MFYVTPTSIKLETEKALMNWFRLKVRESLPEEHKHIADTDEIANIAFGGMFAIDLKAIPEYLQEDIGETGAACLKLNIQRSCGQLMEMLAGFAPIFVERVLASAKAAEKHGGIYFTAPSETCAAYEEGDTGC